MDRLGRLTCAWFDPPEDSDTVDMSITEDDIVDLARKALPSGFEWPHNDRTVQYRKNWSVLTNTAAIVNNPSLSTEWQRIGSTTASVAINSITPEAAETGLQTEGAALALAARLKALHGVPRSMLAITLPIGLGPQGLLSVVRLTHPRFGLSSGRTLVVVAVEEDYTRGVVVMTAWG
jgi:hypothetical protein